jgi:AhpD family alkylhydroperoxidase
LIRFVHIGENRHAEFLTQLGENRQRLVEAEAARAL